MREIIPFKKDIIFKTKISKIIDISLTHDYKILDNIIEGEFLLSGTYKMTEASVVNEEFIYNIPFSISIGSDIDKESINLVLDNFKYDIKEDMLSLKIELGMNCEKIEEEKEVEESIEEELNKEFWKEDRNIDINNIVNYKPQVEIETEIEDSFNKEETQTKQSIMSLSERLKNNKDFVKYKVYIVREDDTIDSIASKYNISINDFKDYNDVDTLNIGDKVVIPFIKND